MDSPFFIYSWLIGLVSAIGFSFFAYFVLSAPFRRIDCANMIVELNELAVATGKSPDRLFCELGSGVVREVPYIKKFSKLYGLIQNGHNFVSSLRIFHSLLPGEIFGSMELARNERGAHLIAKLSRAYLEDGASQAQQSFKLFSSGFLFLFVSIPTFLITIFYTLKGFVLPKFKETLADLSGEGSVFNELGHLFLNLFGSGIFLIIPIIFGCLIILFLVSHFLGISVTHNTGSYMNRVFSHLSWSLPWRRNRIKRNFIWILCELLDSGISEVNAIKVAASATKSSVVSNRCNKAVKDLEKGQSLAQALRQLDRRADLSWRVENAAHGGSSFRETLEGWTGHLSALAYKQQQSAFYYFFTAMMLFNGLFVLSVGMTILLPLATIIEKMTEL